MKYYDKKAIEWFIIAMITNAVMDAIDHSAGAQTLVYVWHVVKWAVFVPALFMAGFYYFPARWHWLRRWRHKALIVACGVALWQIVYNVLCEVFNRYGVPKWF